MTRFRRFVDRWCEYRDALALELSLETGSISFGFEPALLAGFVRACLYALSLFGFDLTEEQILGLVLVVEAGTALFVRSQTVTKAHAANVLEAAAIETDVKPSEAAAIGQAMGVPPKNEQG